MTTTDNWHEMAQSLPFSSDAFIAGEFRPGRSDTIHLTNPVSGSAQGAISACNSCDVDDAVRCARRTFESGVWSEAEPAMHRKVLLDIASRIDADTQTLALLITVEMGKPISDSIGEVAASVAHLRFFAEIADKWVDELPRVGPNATALVTREPVGVVGAIVPWNYPLLMTMWKMAPALAAGNSFILKPAEQSSLSALRLAELVADSSLPEGVFQVLPGRGEEAGQAIARHRDVDRIAFTGSSEVGRLILKYASESNLKGVSLECGGKSALVILPGVEALDAVSTAVAGGIFANAGQMCNAASRLIVHRSVEADLVELVAEKSKKWAPGDPLDTSTKMGPLVDARQFARVGGYIERTAADGVPSLNGDIRWETPPGGYFVPPTIFTGVDNGMPIAQEEVFGPVLSVIGFDAPEQALAIANDSQYGLAAGVWTSDLDSAHRFARQLRAGSVYINCWDAGNALLPFGGYKHSGTGRDKSHHALNNYTQLKSTYIRLAD
jgi:acyl-CoA reductase-like NAD-dependent aldehyde dehydrogenase